MLEEEVSFDLPVRSHASLKKQFCKMYKKSCLGINGVSYELFHNIFDISARASLFGAWILLFIILRI